MPIFWEKNADFLLAERKIALRETREWLNTCKEVMNHIGMLFRKDKNDFGYFEWRSFFLKLLYSKSDYERLNVLWIECFWLESLLRLYWWDFFSLFQFYEEWFISCFYFTFFNQSSHFFLISSFWFQVFSIGFTRVFLAS